MNATTRRRLGVVLGLLILLGGFAASRYFGELKKEPARKPVAATLKSVETFSAQNETLPSTLDVQGQLVAFDKIDIYSEVTGTLVSAERPFKVGSYFPKNSLLIEMDDTEARLSLLSQKSSLMNAITQMMPDLKIDYPESFKNWKQYLENFDVEKPVVDFPEPLNEQEKYFVASRNLHTQFFTIKSAEERLSKYTLRAPFSGVLTVVNTNPGALVRAGQVLGTLMSTSNYELEVTVPLADLDYIKTGNNVKLYSDDIAGEWTGRVRRISDQVDGSTQTVKVFIAVSDSKLREGMYMRGEVNAREIENALRIPRDLLINQTSVYVVRDSFLTLQEVDVVKITEQEAVIRGIKDGTPLLKRVIPGAFDGMKVQVQKESSPAAGKESSNKAMSSIE